MWISAPFESLRQDVRHAARNLRKSPGFVAVVILSLTLGIAANTTMFSVINAELYRPLPYETPDRLMVIWETEQGQPNSNKDLPLPSSSTGIRRVTFLKILP
jgi:hypothetical protein